ncbi:uncharacterized protein LOC114356927 [Ostrinia furnacalis]|uniref:uncharacterized protein LOC114356927 n=1 Tax=Ostrinia furnacalis TaxID=93504 RepID=UPI00103DF639|nr:uncharacterized protein LOC114356927 [Ostrinia furnacalis]
MRVANVGIFLLSLSFFHCLQLIPERANVTYINKKYMEYGRLYISRYGRKSPYYINLEGIIKHTWADNITMHLIFYEYLHNEYRRSFVEVHIMYCKMMKTDPYIGGMLAKHGAPCPAPPGEYKLQNMTLQGDNFPNLFPISKGKIEVELTNTSSTETILKAYATASFVTKAKKKI